MDFAETKQALRLELRLKEKLIREQEMKYLTTDYGLGNVVHGWDITNPTGPSGLTDRQASSTRVMARRKVKDSDKIFSLSSVMSFMTSGKICKWVQRWLYDLALLLIDMLIRGSSELID